MIAVVCPGCRGAERVIRHGTNPCGSARCRCKGCGKTFTLDPKSRAVTPQKEQAIAAALAERISQRGIARALNVSRDTIRQVRKKTQSA